MLKTAKISIIIVTYNSSQHILACLDSLYSQNYGNFEIIVYDNASVDGTQNLICNSYPDVKLIEGETNIGFAAANNHAANLAVGEFLAFLNPDTIVDSDWLRPLVEALQTCQNVGAVTPELVFADNPDIINACGNEIHLSGVTYCREFGMVASDGYPVEVGAISGAAFMLQKELFERIGGLEVGFFMYYEDTDLSLRLRCKGLRCIAVPKSKVRHAYRASFGYNKIFYLERNRYLSLLGLMSWKVLVVMVPSLFLMEIVAWIYCVMKGRQALRAKVRAWRDVIQKWDWVEQRRQNFIDKYTDYAFVIRALSPWLKIQYVGIENNTLSHVLELLGWGTAAPALGIARLIGK